MYPLPLPSLDQTLIKGSFHGQPAFMNSADDRPPNFPAQRSTAWESQVAFGFTARMLSELVRGEMDDR